MKVEGVIDENQTLKIDVRWLKRQIKYLWVALIVGTFLWVKESRDIIIGIGKKYLGL